MRTGERLIAKYGNPLDKEAFEKKWLTVYTLPAWLLAVFPKYEGKSITRIYMHKDMVAPFEKTMRELVDTGLVNELKTYHGCYVVRNQRGADKLSVHSWGLALDFNAMANPLGGKVNFTSKFIDVWRKNGWVCGADWKMPRTDGMHFEWTKQA